LKRRDDRHDHEMELANRRTRIMAYHPYSTGSIE
jgi:hypothetical protein